MFKINNKWNEILRWIFFLPLSFIMYLISKLCITLTFFFINNDLVTDINSVYDFGGHYILGPIFIFIRELLAVTFGVYSGVYFAPSHKKIVFYGFIIIWILYLLIISFGIGYTISIYEWKTEEIIRNLVELFAQIVGLTIVGIYIWKEDKDTFNSNSNIFNY